MPNNKSPIPILDGSIDHHDEKVEYSCADIVMGDDKFPKKSKSTKSNDAIKPQKLDDKFDIDVAAMYYSLLTQVIDLHKDISNELTAYTNETDILRKESLALRRYEATLERVQKQLDVITELRKHEIIIEKFEKAIGAEPEHLSNASIDFKAAYLLNSMSLSIEECKTQNMPYKKSLDKIWKSSEFRQAALKQGIDINQIDKSESAKKRILMLVNRRPEGGVN
jgi:hypothetical protein